MANSIRLEGARGQVWERRKGRGGRRTRRKEGRERGGQGGGGGGREKGEGGERKMATQKEREGMKRDRRTQRGEVDEKRRGGGERI